VLACCRLFLVVWSRWSLVDLGSIQWWPVWVSGGGTSEDYKQYYFLRAGLPTDSNTLSKENSCLHPELFLILKHFVHPRLALLVYHHLSMVIALANACHIRKVFDVLAILLDFDGQKM
jgi:hypothetical protein